MFNLQQMMAQGRNPMGGGGAPGGPVPGGAMQPGMPGAMGPAMGGMPQLQGLLGGGQPMGGLQMNPQLMQLLMGAMGRGGM